MIKAKFGKIEVRLLKNGSFKCSDPDFLLLIESLTKESANQNSDYHPDPDHALMEWLTVKLNGKITYYKEPDYSKYPNDIVFSPLV